MRENLKDSMFNPKGPEKDVMSGPISTNDDEVIVYTIFGKHDEIENGYPVLYDTEDEDGSLYSAEESENACAKLVSVDGRKYMYIKSGHGGMLYNPIGMYQNQYSPNKRIMGRKEWDFMKVNEKAFLYYLDFLKTKNNSYFLRAERELR